MGGFGEGLTQGVGIALGVIIIIVTAAFLGLSVFPTGQGGGQEQPPATGNQYSLQLPIKLTVRDQIVGTTVSGGTIYILDQNDRILETLAVGTDGVATTALAYSTGEQLKFFYSGTGYGAGPMTFTVPYANSEAQQYYYSAIDVVHFPADANITLSIMDKLGSQVATETSQSGATFTDGKAELSLHMVLSEGFGLISYSDPIEKEEDNVLLVFVLNDTLPTITANGLNLKRIEYGSTVYYYATLDDIKATVNDPAIKDISFTVFYSGTAAIQLTVKLFTHTDPDIFASSLTVDSDGFQDSVYPLIIS